MPKLPRVTARQMATVLAGWRRAAFQALRIFSLRRSAADPQNSPALRLVFASAFSLRVAIKEALQQAWRGAERGFSEAVKGGGQIDPAPRGGVVQDSKCARDAEFTSAGFPAAIAFVYEQQGVFSMLHGQSNRFTLSFPQKAQTRI